jgi:hypothetical protein
MHRSAPRRGNNQHSPDQLGHGIDSPRLSLRLSEDMARRLEAYCKRNHVTRSEALTHALEVLLRVP